MDPLIWKDSSGNAIPDVMSEAQVEKAFALQETTQKKQ